MEIYDIINYFFFFFEHIKEMSERKKYQKFLSEQVKNWRQ